MERRNGGRMKEWKSEEGKEKEIKKNDGGEPKSEGVRNKTEKRSSRK